MFPLFIFYLTDLVFICENEEATISCKSNPGTVIHIIRAHFGRTSPLVCASGGNPTNLRRICETKTDHVLAIVRSKCEGHTSCHLMADTKTFRNTCPGVELPYLEVQYYCRIKGRITKTCPCTEIFLKL